MTYHSVYDEGGNHGNLWLILSLATVEGALIVGSQGEERLGVIS